jgi:hypothetical protein
MPRVGFKPTIPGFERAKTVHALDHAATATGTTANTPYKFHCHKKVFKTNGLQSTIFWTGNPEKDEVTKEQRKLCTKEVTNVSLLGKLLG